MQRVEAVVGSAQRVVVARARASRDAAVHHFLVYLGCEHPDFEVEASARLVVQFEDVLPETAQCVACAPIDLDGQVSIIGTSTKMIKNYSKHFLSYSSLKLIHVLVTLLSARNLVFGFEVEGGLSGGCKADSCAIL